MSKPPEETLVAIVRDFQEQLIAAGMHIAEVRTHFTLVAKFPGSVKLKVELEAVTEGAAQ